MRKSLSTLFGLGYLPYSATLASLIALGAYALASAYAVPILIQILFLVGLFIACMIDLYIQRVHASEDPKEIVSDELLGMYLCLAIAGAGVFLSLIFFAIFRALDILKPYPFNLLDGKSRWWILLDDVAIGLCIAGIYRAILLI